HNPWPLRHLVFQGAGLLVVQIQMIPTVPLRGPQDFSRVVKKPGEGLSWVNVTIRLFSNYNRLFSSFGVYGTQFDGFFSSLRCFVIKSLAVWKPVETRPALKMHLNQCSFHFDALSLLNVKDDRLSFWQHFSG